MFEGYIDGEYIKYTNNWVYFNEEVDTRAFTAYAHYTWQATNGEYLVTDL